MKASLRSVRLAPKKANLIAMMVRGMKAADAVEALRRTNKKGARLVEKLLLSAMANASHNAKQDPQTMVIQTIVVNQGTAFRRGMPKARGSMRPYRKFLSHIDITLGWDTDAKDASANTRKNAKKKTAAPASQNVKNPVKTARSSTKTKSKTSTSSESSAS
jgi:large subunit ribosomal protein L22